jgi:hypothetical protein
VHRKSLEGRHGVARKHGAADRDPVAGERASARAWRALTLLACVATSTQAAVLPLRPGTYVLANTPCRDPALAGVFSYDGRQFSYPHASRCRSEILSSLGRTYRVRETCSALGDGAPAAPVTTILSYRIMSATQVWVSHPNRRFNSSYRWCPAR